MSSFVEFFISSDFSHFPEVVKKFIRFAELSTILISKNKRMEFKVLTGFNETTR